MDEKQLGESLRALRRRCGLSQEQVAQMAGVSRMAVLRIERGKGSSLATFLAINHTLGGVLPDYRMDYAARRRLEVHKEVARVLRSDPAAVLVRAQRSLREVFERASSAGCENLVIAWHSAMKAGAEEVARLCVLETEHGDEMRKYSPFTDALSSDEQSRVLARV